MVGLNNDLKVRENSGEPVKIGLVGAGQMGTDVVAQVTMMQGIDVVAIADIDEKRAEDAYRIAGMDESPIRADSAEEADRVVESGKRIFVKDYKVITGMNNIDVMLEATGVPEIGVEVVIRTIRSGKHISMMNVETDITVGPLLNWYAEKNNVLYALAAGDEPAACKELYDFADALGFTVIAAGKGKNNPLDRHAKPTDKEWAIEAGRRGLTPTMLIEFVDGSKTMIEMAAVSNATGLSPNVRGMHGPYTSRDTLHKTFCPQKDGGVFTDTGVVDYGIGNINPGVFVIFTTDHPRLKQALVYRDMGDGPYYTLFRPYHLCSLEVPLTCAMLVIRRQTNMKPLEKKVSEVFAVAKQDLSSGEILDSIGGCAFYSLIDNYETAQKENLLPVGIAKGARLKRSVKQDTPITFDDVELSEQSLLIRLRRLQDMWIDGEFDEKMLLDNIEQLAV